MRKLAEGGDAADFVKAVAEALAESATLDVSEDGAKVRRKAPMPGAHDATPTSTPAVCFALLFACARNLDNIMSS